jgi:perosamine synthetase
MSTEKRRAAYGAEALKDTVGELPGPFPRTVGPRAMEYLQEVVDGGLATDLVGRFEKAYAEAHGVQHCIATPGCTPALAVLAAALDLDPGDEVIVSPITDYGTIQGLVSQHLIPVFADAEAGTVNLSASTIKPCISQRTRAILVVHKTGLICDMDPINQLAAKHDLVVYEDACQAVFGRYRGRLAGTLARAGAFSFDSEKSMGSDIGGCVITDDGALAERMRLVGQSRGALMEPGFGRKHAELGYAYRMTQCTAAISLAQLDIIVDQVRQRDRMARLLTDLIADIPDITPLPIPDYVDVYSCWMFGLNVDPGAISCSVDDLAAQLATAGVSGAGTGRYYLMPAALSFLQEQAERQVYPYSCPPASRQISYSADSCPQARDFLESFIRWSTFCDKYTEQHCELAAQIVRDVMDQNRR